MFLFAGRENAIFGESNRFSAELLRERNPHIDVVFESLPNYGHADVFMGRYAHVDVFPKLLSFLEVGNSG